MCERPQVNRDKVLVYQPETTIEAYARPLAVLAASLRSEIDADVYWVQCSGELPYCSMMAMYFTSASDVELKKQELCSACQNKHYEIIDSYGFCSLPMASFINAETEKRTAEIWESCKHDPVECVYDSFPLGKFGVIDFFLATKNIDTSDLSATDSQLLELYIKNVIFICVVFEGVARDLAPKYSFWFNDYASCQALRFFMQQVGSRAVSVAIAAHLGFDGSLLAFSNRLIAENIISCLPRIGSYSKYFIPSTYIQSAFDDMLFRFYGSNSHIFSISKSKDAAAICLKLGLDIHKKIVVVYTSSVDERYALDTTLDFWYSHKIEKGAFADQIEWLKELRNHALQTPDVQYIVRVHPREGASKRPRVSRHFELLSEKFAYNEKNFIMVWPEDPVSSYDILEMADVVLVAWSSMGAEACRIGIPVLCWAEGLYYNYSDCVRVASTREEYFLTLAEMLQGPVHPSVLLNGIKFYCWRSLLTVLDVSASIDHDPYRWSYWPEAQPEDRSAIMKVLCGQTTALQLNLERIKEAQICLSEEQEWGAILEGMCAIIHATFCPPRFKPVPLWFKIVRKLARIIFHKQLLWDTYTIPQVSHYSSVKLECYLEEQIESLMRERTREDPLLCVLISIGAQNTYFKGGKIYRRYSKMIARFAGFIRTIQRY